MAIKAVIFDMDGTLVDSLTSYQTAFNRGAAKFGLPPRGVKELTDCLTLGMKLEEVIVVMYPGHEDPEFLSACRQEMYNAFLTLSDDTSFLLPDALHVLKELKARGIKMGIATGRGSQSSRVRETFHKLGIDHFFDAVVTCSDFPRKPAPDSVVECARQLEVDPCECLFVGDAVADIEAAKGAGATPIAVTTGVSDEAKLVAHQPARIFHQLSDILDLFE